MINKQRVKRIKTLIYAFVIIVLFLPLILMSILSFKMFDVAEKINSQLDDIQSAVSSQSFKSAQNGPENDAPDDGYVIEPEDQSANRQNESSGAEGSDSMVSGEVLPESGEKPVADTNYGGNNTQRNAGDALTNDSPGAAASQSGSLTPGTKEVGSGTSAGITGNTHLESDSAQGGVNSGDAGLIGGNPQTGGNNGTQIINQKNINGNPITGR